MIADCKYDAIVKKAIQMRHRVLSGEFPDEVELWNNLLSKDMVHFLPVGIVLLNRDFVLLKCNEQYKHYIDTYSSCPSKNARGKNYFDLFSSTRSSLTDVLKNVRDNELQHTDKETPLCLDKRKTKQLTYWDAKVVPVKDRHKKTIGIIITTKDVTGLVTAQEKIQKKDNEINDLKVALRTLMDMRQEDLAIQEQKITANIKHIIEPFINNLKNKNLSYDIKNNLEGIEFGFNQFTSDFSYLFRNKEVSLTPKEIQVAAMIKMGKTSKDIAACFNVSPASIDFHRKNIRAKLNLKNKKTNLQTYLRSLFSS